MDSSLCCIRDNLIHLCSEKKEAPLFIQVRVQIVPKESPERKIYKYMNISMMINFLDIFFSHFQTANRKSKMIKTVNIIKFKIQIKNIDPCFYDFQKLK